VAFRQKVCAKRMLFFALTVCNTIYAKEHLANRSLILPLCVAF